MTDRENLEKVRAEIERRYRECNGATPATEYQELLDFIDSLQEEPISKIWHEPIERPDSNKVVLIIVRCGYIGDPGMPHLAKYDSHNNQYIDKDRTDVCNHPIMYHVDSVEKWVYIDDILNLTTKEAGMEKMKEQMMAKGVDGDITFDYYGDDDKTYGCIAHDSFCLEDFGLKDRDKVKVIVIKKD